MASDSKALWDETHRLVGEFMNSWAFLEAGLNDIIKASLKLDGIQATIVTANIQVRDKIFICRTVIDMAHQPEAWREAANKTLLQVSRYADQRNVAAHTMFGPADDGDGVMFLRVKAKGKLSWPEERWPQRAFQEKIHDMAILREALANIAERFGEHSFSYADLMATTGATTPRPTGGGLLSMAARQRQSAQSLPSPIPGAIGEIPHDPLEGVKMLTPDDLRVLARESPEGGDRK